MPLSTVGLVLRRLGLGRLRALDPRPPVIRYERKHPGEIIHIDTKKLGRINGPGHRMTGHRRGRKRGSGWEYLHVAIDDASRLAYTEVLASETGEACAGFMTRAARWFAACGVRIQRVMSDNAFAYTNSRLFKDALKAIGARHITTRPYNPKDQRQGRALHPDRAQRMALCQILQLLRQQDRRHATLDSLVQSPQTPRRHQRIYTRHKDEQPPW